MSSYKIAEENKRKTLFLMFLFFVIISAMGWWFSKYFDNIIILYGAAAFSILTNIFSYYQSDKIALKMSGAVPADPKNELELKAIRAVENMAMAGNMLKPRVYIIHDEAMNAFATGRDQKHAAVAITTGLLKRLEKTEIEAVVSHELGHIRNRDILVMSVVITLVGLIAVLADFGQRILFSRGEKKSGPLVIIGLALMIFAPLIAQLIRFAVSRKREFIADATGAEISRHPKALASALRKISQNPAVSKASSATAHLYISNPMTGGIKFLQKAFSTHPPMEERIALLEKM